MKRLTSASLRPVALLVLTTCLCVAGQTSAQTKRQLEIKTTPGEPGLPVGYTIIDGDIQMPISIVNAMRRQAAPGIVSAPDTNLGLSFWPNGIVPYEFQTNCVLVPCSGVMPTGCVSAANQQNARDAMAVLQAVANVRFVQCNDNACSPGSYIRIRDSTNDRDSSCNDTSNNSSPVGRQNQGFIVNLTSWTLRFSIVHELVHALGFFHEQSRPDRNQFVEVEKYCGNVRGGCMGTTYLANFRPEGFHYSNYDFDSVMHYGQCDFSNNTNCPSKSTAFPDGGITLEVKQPYYDEWQPKIGQTAHLSVLDKLTLSLVYGQPNYRFVDTTPNFPTIQNGSLLFPYDKLSTALAAVPVGGTLWLEPGQYTVVGELRKNVTLRAPLGDVTIRPGVASAFPSTLATVSAASYGGELAADSIVAAFGLNLAASTETAISLPLPTTLAGVTVRITDSEQVTRAAPLFFVSPSQINLLVPADLKPGLAKIIVYNGERVAASGEASINPVAPALFAANADGRGVPAAYALRVRADGSQSQELVAQFDPEQQRFVPVPLDLGPEGDQVFLVLFGTGFRARTEPEAVAAIIGDELAAIFYAGTAPGYVGLDQANVLLPRSLAGKGTLNLLLMVDNRAANEVTVNIR